jgi:hypothetical protein
MPLQAHPHQHSVKVIGSGVNLEQALSHALGGLTDPEGHYSRMSFHSFEISRLGGAFAADGSRTVQVTLEAFASHQE